MNKEWGSSEKQKRLIANGQNAATDRATQSKVAGMWRNEKVNRIPSVGTTGKICTKQIGDDIFWLDESPLAVAEATYEDERIQLAKFIDARGDEIKHLTDENDELKRKIYEYEK